MPSKILIVGCGAVTQEHHAPALSNLASRGIAEVVGVCDPVAAHTEKLARLFPRARTFTTLTDVPEGFAQIALIASPVRWHAEQSIHCLNAGLSVLCEKPMAATTAETFAMNEAAERNRRALAVGHVRRFCTGTRLIKGLVAEARFGRLLSFSAVEGGNFAWDARTASFFERKNAGGGVLMDLGIHTLDLLEWWFGEPASFNYEDDAMGGLEANCRLALDYGSFQGDVQLTRDHAIPNAYFFKFEHAWVRWKPSGADQIEIGFDGLDLGVEGRLFSAHLENGVPAGQHPAELFHQCFLLQWLNIIAAHEGREAPRITGAQAARSLALVEKCYRSRSFMEPPWFTELEKLRARELHRKA
jgi:predicted dehydrogenase